MISKKLLRYGNFSFLNGNNVAKKPPKKPKTCIFGGLS
jgi:hypothetical protein